MYRSWLAGPGKVDEPFSNGDYRLLAVSITLVLAITGMAYWVGSESEQIIELRAQMGLLQEVNQRLSLIEERAQEIDTHLNYTDQRVQNLEQRSKK